MKFIKRNYPALILLLVIILAYGLLSLRLGFYWDDLPITWIRYQLGREALTQYFSTNRPVWGVLHQITTSFLPQVPAYWQIFALLWRWLGAVIVYLIAAKLWKGGRTPALSVALLFLVYPGFNQHWAAYLYSHFYIVLFFFLTSFLCTLLAIERPEKYWLWTGVGLVLSALNLWMMEYFYVLELARVGLILTAIRDEEMSLLERLKRTFKLWLPYLALFALSVVSRLFIFNNQVYGISLTGQLKSAPIDTLIALARNIKLTMRLVLRDAWFKIFELPAAIAHPVTILPSYYLVVTVLVLIVAAGFLWMPSGEEKPLRKNVSDALWMIGFGVLALALSGWPFWLIGFVPSLNWPASRFTLPFMLGVALFFAGVIALIPWEKVRIVLLVSLISMSAGKQYLTSNVYLQDWESQKDLFWQMTWRAPSIEPDTLVLMNESLDFYADNSLSAALNWIYAPDNHSSHVDYVLFFPTTRFQNALPEIAPDIPIYYDYLAGEFNGNTSRTLAFYYDPPACLRLLDPAVERVNRLIPETSLMRYAARLTDPSLILNEPGAKMPVAYGPEPKHDFCYYYQKADLARQLGDWDTVLKMSDLALSDTAHPFEPAEQLVFIEGFAHAGQWGRAVELSQQVNEVSPEIMSRVLCRLWRRVGAETTQSPERTDALAEIQSMFACSP